VSTSPHIVIAIDGPAASGKSSTSQWVAEKLGFLHVDSGSLYRALTAALLRQGAPPERWTPSVMVGHASRIGLRAESTSFTALVDGAPAEEEIRGSLVTSHVSLVARVPEVRAWVNAKVREAATDHDVVVDGRDMGTAVFPDATLKIFLIADPWERARRRLVQRLDHSPTEEEIAVETALLVQRDSKDATQTVQAKDAVVLDTTYLTQAEQVERIVALARAVSWRPDGT
jgi:cytidylate kinase